MRRYEQELGCKGYWGFGGGFAHARGFRSSKDGELYCSGGCLISSVCWESHKQRTAEIVPAMTAKFEEMAVDVQGPELMERWHELTQSADPYTIIIGGNIEDGMAVGFGAQPKDRGPYTLPWPLEPRA